MIADEIWILTAFSVVPQNFLILVSSHGTNQKNLPWRERVHHILDFLLTFALVILTRS